MATPNRTTTQVRDANIVAGIGKRLQNVQTLNLGGAAYAPSALTQLFQSGVDASANIAALRAQVKDALQAELLLTKKLNALAKALKTYVVNEFGSTSSALGDFGFVPPKAPAKNPVTKVVAAAKMRNTRVARNTKGKRQKEEIVGQTPQSISIAVTSSGKPGTPVANGSEAGAVTSAAPPPPAVVQASSTSSSK
jgi:hypothetical protein